MKKWLFLMVSVLFCLLALPITITVADTQPALWFMDDLKFTQAPGGKLSHAGTLKYATLPAPNL